MATSTAARGESLRDLEREVAVLIRRIRHVIGERAQSVHPDLQSSGYLMLSWLIDQGPVRSSTIVDCFHIDKGAISRQLQHLTELGLVDRTPDPDDGRAHLVTASPEAVRRLEDVTADRRVWLDERLGDWSAERLAGFVTELQAYNEALTPEP